MAVTPIANAFLDNAGLAIAAEMFRQTSVGIGSFDGYAAHQSALPAATDNNSKTYFVGDSSRPYTSDGTNWAPGAIVVVCNGAKFDIPGGWCVFTTVPTYDRATAPTTASGGICATKTYDMSRALTAEEISTALTTAGF
jgi:hypothetical protein